MRGTGLQSSADFIFIFLNGKYIVHRIHGTVIIWKVAILHYLQLNFIYFT